MKRLLFISMLLMTTTVLFGQSLKISSDPIHPCVNSDVVFSAALESPTAGNKTYRLYRDASRIEKIGPTTESQVSFSSVSTKVGNYYVTVTIGSATPISSDTIVVANLESEFSATECAGAVYTWNEHTYSRPGDYTQVLESSTGCDSTVTLHLSYLDPIEYAFDASTCEGEPYVWDGRTYTDEGDYPYTYTAANTCDSVVTLHLKVIHPTTSMNEHTICSGETYTWNGNNYNATGTYEFSTTGSNGCDSVATLKLTVLDPITSSLTVSTCYGQPYVWDGRTYTEAGVYTHTYTAHNGYNCDSVVTLNLTVLPQIASTEEATVCPGESFDWNGQSYSEAGTYTATFEAANGCDSIATLELTVKKMTEVKISGDPTLCHNSSSIYSVSKVKGYNYDWTVSGGTITNGNETNKITVLWNGTGKGEVCVSVENTDGCVAYDTLEVSVSTYVDAVNDIHIKMTKDSISYMLIYMNPENDLKYQWYKDEVAITGATSQYYMVEGGLPAGAYKVYISQNVDSDGNLFCGAFSGTVNIAAPQKARFVIFPNPASEGAELSLSGLTEKVTVSIYTIDGRLIRQIIADGNGTLPVRLPNGCYFVEIIDAQRNKQVEKLIIK